MIKKKRLLNAFSFTIDPNSLIAVMARVARTVRGAITALAPVRQTAPHAPKAHTALLGVHLARSVLLTLSLVLEVLPAPLA